MRRLSLIPLLCAFAVSADAGFRYQQPLPIDLTHIEKVDPSEPGESFSWSLGGATLPVAAVGEAYAFDFSSLVSAHGELGALSWTAVDFPGWLSLGSNGVATGVASGASVEITVIVTSVERGSREQSYTLNVSEGWESFATVRSLSYREDWGSIDWRNVGLSSLPISPYPNSAPRGINLRSNELKDVDGLSSITVVSGALYLDSNNLTNVDGLSSLTSAESILHLGDNELTNVDGLSSLSLVGGNFYLNKNRLSNVDGLSSLISVGGTLNLRDNNLINVDGLASLAAVGIDLGLYNNPNLVDLHGLASVQLKSGSLLVDKGIHLRPGFVPIPSHAWICQPEQSSRFGGSGYAKQSEVCEL